MKNIICRAGTLILMALSLAGVASATPTISLLYSFDLSPSDGNGHVSELTVGSHGSLYGTTRDGGAYGYGTVFKLSPPSTSGGAWKKTIIHSFCEQFSCLDGSKPIGSLVFYQGAIFGTTTYGGFDCGEDGCGTIFKMSPPVSAGDPWTYAVIYYFKPSGSGQQVDGTNPLAGLTVDSQGVLYGTTNGGGLYGYGTVFRMPPDTGHGWNMTVLNAFGAGDDGTYPQASVILVGVALYGTTSEGGSKGGYGTIFQVKPPTSSGGAWKETVLYSFGGGNDGAYPVARLTAGPKGALYGTTSYAGALCDASTSCGTVFRLSRNQTTSGWSLATLHSFPYNDNDGQWPQAGVIFGEDGALYGTTEYGGASPGGPGSGHPRCGFLYNCGTIFRLTGSGDSWTENWVYRFCAGAFCTTGAYPTAGLVAYQGAIYGTTSFQGEGYACNCGTIFRLNY